MKDRQLCQVNQLNNQKVTFRAATTFHQKLSLKERVWKAHQYAFHCNSWVVHCLLDSHKNPG